MHFKGWYDLYNLKAQGEVICADKKTVQKEEIQTTAEMPNLPLDCLLMAMLPIVNFYNVKNGS